MISKKRSRRTKLFAVIGLGRFGSSLARTLYSMGYEVLAVDLNEDRVQEMAKFVTHSVQADGTDENAMRSMGIRNVDVAIVSIGILQPSILTTVIMKELSVKYIVAKAVSEVHGKVLEKLGADRVVYPERDMGNRLAHNLMSGNLIDYIELAPNYAIVEVIAKEAFTGKTLKEIDLRAKYGINVIAVKRGNKIDVVPGADFIIKSKDILVAMGADDKLEQIEEKVF